MELVASAPQHTPGAPHVPPILVRAALRMLASSVKSRAGFDLYKLRAIDAARTCYIPALFGTGNADVLVRPHHSKLIYDEYVGDKNLVTFEGDHNETRPDFFMDSAAIFLKTVLLLPEAAGLQVPLDHRGRPMPIAHAFSRASGGTGTFSLPPLTDITAQRSDVYGLLDAEEEQIRQAIAASLASAGESATGAAALTEVLGSSPTCEAAASVETANAPSPAALAVPGTVGNESGSALEEDLLLQDAIRLSLNSK